MVALGLTLWLIIVGAPLALVLWWLLSQYEQRHPVPKHKINRF